MISFLSSFDESFSSSESDSDSESPFFVFVVEASSVDVGVVAGGALEVTAPGAGGWRKLMKNAPEARTQLTSARANIALSSK